MVQTILLGILLFSFFCFITFLLNRWKYKRTVRKQAKYENDIEDEKNKLREKDTHK